MSARHPHLMALHPRHPRHRAEPSAADLPATPFDIALARAALLPPADRQQRLDPSAAAFAAFRAGQGSLDHWRHMVDALNVSEALARRHRIAPDHLHTIEAGLQALAAVYQRQARSWTLHGSEIAALDDALFIWGVQLAHCSRGEMAAARKYVISVRTSARHGHVGKHVQVLGRPTAADAAHDAP